MKDNELTEKWSPLLNLTPEIEGFDKDEQDNMMAQMFENQVKYTNDKINEKKLIR